MAEAVQVALVVVARQVVNVVTEVRVMVVWRGSAQLIHCQTVRLEVAASTVGRVAVAGSVVVARLVAVVATTVATAAQTEAATLAVTPVVGTAWEATMAMVVLEVVLCQCSCASS